VSIVSDAPVEADFVAPNVCVTSCMVAYAACTTSTRAAGNTTPSEVVALGNVNRLLDLMPVLDSNLSRLCSKAETFSTMNAPNCRQVLTEK
jgi:hypothetical protein